MKIDSNPLPTPPTATQPSSAERASQRTIERLYGSRQNSPAEQVRDHEAGSDHVAISELSHHLRVLASESPDRTERIGQLSRLVQSGQYNPDPGEVSRRIVDDSISL